MPLNIEMTPKIYLSFFNLQFSIDRSVEKMTGNRIPLISLPFWAMKRCKMMQLMLRNFHQRMWIQRYCYKLKFSSFYTQTFHYSLHPLRGAQSHPFGAGSRFPTFHAAGVKKNAIKRHLNSMSYTNFETSKRVSKQ